MNDDEIIKAQKDSNDPRIVHIMIDCESPKEVMYTLISMDNLDAFDVKVEVKEERHDFGSTHLGYQLYASVDSRSPSYAMYKILQDERQS